ncbi:MAG: phosphoenolpyruvate carboxylase [Candidatus Aquicultor sp.]|nr:phosphoenolpyruvate carboxylase [Candidatus Aquicultor sp.]
MSTTRKIPRCMSTQHPDNVTAPFFAADAILGGEDEIKEAYYAYSHLGCDEQMWDCEGKEVDNYVVRKLLTRYKEYFIDNKLGEDVFLTLRVPNPTVEREEAKVLLETLEGIPRAFDTARALSLDSPAPVFEVILPMTTSARCLYRIYVYYRDFVAGKQDKLFCEGDVSIADWIGGFEPHEVHVIPLMENKEGMLNAHNIVEEYVSKVRPPYQRVFLARSDPAMNYGLVSSVLLNKIALQRLHRLSKNIGVEIYPIIGVGSAPFRGNLKPTNVMNCLEEYPSVQTFTVQSAFKYDYPEREVMSAIDTIKAWERKDPTEVDEAACLRVMDKLSREYTRQVELLAPLINTVAKYVPARRKRKLHVGLFGYSRSVGSVSLPRVISFCASLYSIGLPPELLALNALTDDDRACLKSAYLHFEDDLRDAMAYFNEDVLDILPGDLGDKIRRDIVDYEVNRQHREITSRIIENIKEQRFANIQEQVVEAAWTRRFLG